MLHRQAKLSISCLLVKQVYVKLDKVYEEKYLLFVSSVSHYLPLLLPMSSPPST